MKILRGIIIVCLLVTLCFSLVACGAGNPLVGRWESQRTDGIYFFWHANTIEFRSDGQVYESSDGEWARWETIGQGRIRVTTQWRDQYDFAYEINGGQLRLMDRDGDVNTYRKR